MAAIAFNTVFVLSEMLAKRGLVQVVQLLALPLGLVLHDGNGNKLRVRLLSLIQRQISHWEAISRLLLSKKDWD